MTLCLEDPRSLVSFLGGWTGDEMFNGETIQRVRTCTQIVHDSALWRSIGFEGQPFQIVSLLLRL